jgi:hypothetical protein
VVPGGEALLLAVVLPAVRRPVEELLCMVNVKNRGEAVEDVLFLLGLYTLANYAHYSGSD